MGADEAPRTWARFLVLVLLANEAPRVRVWVLIVTGVLGLAATALALAAEFHRSKTYDIQADGNGGWRCVSPPSAAYNLAAFSIILLSTALSILYMAALPPFFSDLPPIKQGPALKWALATNLLTIISYGAALTLIVLAIKVEDDNHSDGPRDVSGTLADVKCTLVSGGVFATAAICSLVSLVLSEISYVCFRRSAFQHWLSLPSLTRWP